MSAKPDNSDGNGSNRNLGLAVVAIVACSVLAFVLLRKEGPVQNGPGPDPDGDPVSAADCERWNSLLNESIGNLESEAYAKADQSLSELAARFPNEPAAVRNLAICRTLAVIDPKAAAAFKDPAVAIPAIEAARALDRPGAAQRSCRIAGRRAEGL